MFSSHRLLSKIEHIRKKHRDADLQEQIDQIATVFTDCIRELPTGMAEDIFQHFAGQLQSATEANLYGAQAQRMADVVDLFAGDYDSENDPLLPDDWQFVRDIVSERAMELDMDLVTYLMKLVVDHGHL